MSQPQVISLDGPLAAADADVWVVGVYQDSPLEGEAAAIDRALGGAVTRLMEREEISGSEGEASALLGHRGAEGCDHVILLGLGKREQVNAKTAYRSAALASRKAARRQRQRVAWSLGLPAELHEAAIAGAMVGCQGVDLYRSERKLFPYAELAWLGGGEAVASGQILGESVNLARELVNRPASEIYPESFADRAAQVAADAGMQIEIWDQARLESERCGALLAVSRGSDRPPRLVTLTHEGAAEGPWLALVGKGVTFDSGGLSLKPSESMKAMKCDMAGAAAVVGAMQAIARLKLPVRVMGLCGLVENMVNGNAYKLGDVLTSRNGKTIEVLNTDAEGRLVLADVLDVAVEKGASKIIDLATLTGACLVALGTDVAGVMSNDDAWCRAVLDAAERCGERAWQLPMFEEYGKQIRSAVADIKNIGEGRWGGAITAAKFLEEFVQKRPWVHLDIAGPAFYDSAKSWLDEGGTGAFVRTLVEVARRWQSAPSSVAAS